MTEKTIFVYKLLVSLNILDFILFTYKLQPPWKKSPPLSRQSPLFQNLVGVTPPPIRPLLQQKEGGSAHYAWWVIAVSIHVNVTVQSPHVKLTTGKNATQPIYMLFHYFYAIYHVCSGIQLKGNTIFMYFLF